MSASLWRARLRLGGELPQIPAVQQHISGNGQGESLLEFTCINGCLASAQNRGGRSMLATSSSAGGRWLCLGRRRPSLSTAGASPSSAPAAVTVTTYDPTREAAMMVKSRQLYRHGFGSVCCSGPAKEPDWQYEKPETKRQEAMQGRRGAGKFIPWVKVEAHGAFGPVVLQPVYEDDAIWLHFSLNGCQRRGRNVQRGSRKGTVSVSEDEGTARHGTPRQRVKLGLGLHVATPQQGVHGRLATQPHPQCSIFLSTLASGVQRTPPYVCDHQENSQHGHFAAILQAQMCWETSAVSSLGVGHAIK
ncbi:hypothetical protein AK812_SmicGene36563 [Symbiodinium microadriaticum]|uniref:Uncharacterized protein n=1 Tax=Symbiodinium microadriaticum TaxID=2951 RepID=A0A1Q9CIN3_SYMMI|nr:hypothetical protein AK812_SmicGene36563 [Symbiodinium microadriaticum]